MGYDLLRLGSAPKASIAKVILWIVLWCGLPGCNQKLEEPANDRFGVPASLPLGLRYTEHDTGPKFQIILDVRRRVRQLGADPVRFNEPDRDVT